MKEEESKRIFEFKELGYTDLEGNWTVLPLTKEVFSNALFKSAPSIELDTFAREVHKHGKAEINEEVEAQILELLPQLWIFRVNEAIKELINKSK